MYTLTKNKLFSNLLAEMFDDFSNGVESYRYAYPKVNTVETENDFRVDVYYPGLKKEDFKIKVENKTLSIISNLTEKNDENNEKYHFREFSNRGFSKTFIIPESVVKTKIKASYEDGVLKIVIPKDKAKEKQLNFDIPVE